MICPTNTKSDDVNLGYLLKPNFIFSFERLPRLQYFCQGISVPSINLAVVKQPNPFIDVARPGDKLTHDSLTVNYIMDEKLYVWEEIHNWIEGLGFPDEFEEYKNIGIEKGVPPKKKPQYADSTLTFMSPQGHPFFRIMFQDCFPIEIGGFQMITTEIGDAVSCSVNFAFTGMHSYRL